MAGAREAAYITAAARLPAPPVKVPSLERGCPRDAQGGASGALPSPRCRSQLLGHDPDRGAPRVVVGLSSVAVRNALACGPARTDAGDRTAPAVGICSDSGPDCRCLVRDRATQDARTCNPDTPSTVANSSPEAQAGQTDGVARPSRFSRRSQVATKGVLRGWP